MKRLLVVLALLSSASIASAGPALLGSFDGHLHGPGSAPADPSVAFVLEIEGAESYAQIGETLFWGEGGTGIVDFTPDSEPDFSTFASLLTNGSDDILKDGVFWESGGVLSPNLESALFSGLPGFIGYELTLIRLNVHDVHFTPFQLLGLEGLSVNYSLTYEFYGTPVPEPSTLFCISGGLIAILGPTFQRRNSDIEVLL